MSFEAAAWAIKRRTSTNTAKLVLIALSDCHNAETGRCDPGNTYLADLAQCSNRTVIRSIEELVSLGLITCEKSNGVKTNYRLNLDKTSDTHDTGTSDTSVTGEEMSPVTSVQEPVTPMTPTGDICDSSFSIEPGRTRGTRNEHQNRIKFPDWGEGLVNQFWEEYPRKVEKKKAVEKLRSLILKNQDREFWLTVIDHVRKRWPPGSDKKFILHPTTFLNGERWEDDIEPNRWIANENRRPAPKNALRRIEDQTREIFARAEAREAAERSVATHEPVVRPQVGFSGRGGPG